MYPPFRHPGIPQKKKGLLVFENIEAKQIKYQNNYYTVATLYGNLKKKIMRKQKKNIGIVSEPESVYEKKQSSTFRLLKKETMIG